MTIREMGALLRSRQASSRELVEEALRLAYAKPELHAFITITESQALFEAVERDRELSAGIDRGSLHGIPIAYKDLFYTEGVRTTAGSRIFENFTPSWDADVVKRLREAGAVSIGKTNLHELALGITSLNPHFGAVLNPLDERRLAGGSSGGSGAAIAAKIVPMALGTDTGGSIRIPASYCGIAGFKPTYGLVSCRGVLPLAFSLDHVGPMGATVEDCALSMNCMADRKQDFNLPPLADFHGVRVGVPRNFFFEHVEQTVATRVQSAIDAMERAGAQLVQTRVPDFGELNTVSHMILLAEFAALYADRTDRTVFGDDLWSLLEQGRMVAAHDYVNAQRLRALFCEEMDAVWPAIDVLATPTTPIVSPMSIEENVQIGSLQETVRGATTRLVRGINCLGLPALSIPCGTGQAGMPVGLQLIARAFHDVQLLQIGKTLEGILER